MIYLPLYLQQALPLTSQRQHNYVNDVLVNDRIIEFDLPRYYDKSITINTMWYEERDRDAPRILLSYSYNALYSYDVMGIFRYACEHGYLRCIKYILENKLIHVNSYMGWYTTTPLYLVLYECKYNIREIIEYLIEKGADLYKGDLDKNALMFAIEYQSTDIVRYIAEVEPELLNENLYKETTPLMYALENNAPFDTVKYLIDRGASLYYQNMYNNTPPIAALEYEYTYMVIDYMLKCGLDINHTNDIGETVLTRAIDNSVEPDLIRFLVNNGATVDDYIITRLQREGYDDCLIECTSKIDTQHTY